MSVTTATFHFYDSWVAVMCQAVNLATDTFKIGLCTSDYVPSTASHAVLADISGECSGNGYDRQELGFVSFDQVSGVATFTFSNPIFTADGGPITARYFFIYDDTVSSPMKPLMCYGLLDENNLNVITTAGNTLMLNVNASGLFSISK